MSFLKLNVDAHLHDDGRWGYGMILRRPDGRCIGAATKVLKGSDDVTLAEAVGIREALNWVVSQHHQRVIIKTDAEIIVKVISKKSFPRSNWGKVIQNCARDLEGLSHVSVTWVNRKGNQIAHGLGCLAMSKPNITLLYILIN
jgi:ribonuclease HI